VSGRGAEPVSVSCWGELRGEKKIPGAFRVLVGGQHAGAVHREESGWIAEVHGLRQTAPATHETADAAVQAVLRSCWGRRLGARAASRICWTDKATRAAARTGGAR
jgi:hypothetical protein